MTLLHLGPLHAVQWVMFLALLLGPVAALATTVRPDARPRPPHPQ